jgi:hypothetical protein
MKLSSVLGLRRMRIRNRIVTLGVIVTGMLSAALAIVTFYGQEAGNFVISVDSAAKVRGIHISETEDFEQELSRLMSDPIDEARDVTYSWLKIEEVEATNGNYRDIDHDYVAYTFYVMNKGSETVDLTYYIRITDVYNNLDKAIRVLVIEDGVEKMFMKPDQILEGQEEPYYPDSMPEPNYFLTSNMVMRHTIEKYKPGQLKKFSIIIWLEGYDPDTTDDIYGGMIKMTMNFTINQKN